MMGMAIIEDTLTPKPRYKNTVVCHYCHAEYSRGGWVYGVNLSEGTASSSFRKIGDIPDNHCPVCRTMEHKKGE